MNMTCVLHTMIDVSQMVGAVGCVHMYSKNFFTIEGKTEDGKEFSLTLHIKEEEDNGN